MPLRRTIPAFALSLATASAAFAAVPHFEGFEDSGWTANQPGNWQNYTNGKIQRVASGGGVAGVASSSGSAHAEIYDLTMGTDVFNNPSLGAVSPYTQFGGYSSSFNGGYTASLDVYLDATWADGQGFDYSVASNNQSGNHLRDFMFHVGVVNGDLLVNASNNTDRAFNSFKLLNENGGNNYTVASSGWYTFEQVFYEDGGNLAVDLNLYDSSDSLLYSVTRSTTDDIATIVGGNRYGYFTYNNIEGLAIDNTSLQAIPEPASLGLLAAGGLMLAKRRRLS